jgi:negative regulator of flagellin synthesis FlgM
MVDPIGAKPVTAVDRHTGPVEPVASQASAPTAAPGGVNASGVATIARQLAAQAPIDPERVAQLKQAIASGRYPIDPEAIADRMIARKQEWKQ